MPNITVLDQSTINKIAAGEVIERPASVVKELLENAIDAKATAVTVEIKDGGTTFIRVTDNGCGIPREEIPLAFLPHSTSKIKSVEDLFTVASLGFRGEALASIASVCQVELISKTRDSLTGSRYQIEGGAEKELEEIGAPEGTTFIARNLFYNTPARKKFLKADSTEGAHVADLVEKIALSRPDISIRFIQNNQNKLHTAGNHNLKDMIYTIFGREIAANLLAVNCQEGEVLATGFVGKPVIARGNRNYENYYINGRYIKSSIVSKAIEEAYKPFMMQHKYPFTLLHFTIQPEFLDVNVHPTKMELRFCDGEMIYQMVYQAVSSALAHKELIPQVNFEKNADQKLLRQEIKKKPVPEPFEKKRMESFSYDKVAPAKPSIAREEGSHPYPSFDGRKTIGPLERMVNPHKRDLFLDSLDPPKERYDLDGLKKSGQLEHQDGAENREKPGNHEGTGKPDGVEKPNRVENLPQMENSDQIKHPPQAPDPSGQLELFDGKLLEPKAREKHKLIGQLFDTYWLIEYRDQLYIIDQHAAHEKVLYERTMASLKTREYGSQVINPPIILTLNMNEEVMLKRHMDYFTEIGFEIEHFGGKEYTVRGVPANLFSIAKKELLMEMVDGLSEEFTGGSPDLIYEKIASMSCKAAVKGNNSLSAQEANALVDQLLDLENPYACPHGRPTIISMSKYELEKKFKRIL